MKNDDIYRVMRHDLDEKLHKFVRLPDFAPKRGWVNALRVAMQMTHGQLGLRMGNFHKNSDLELNEAKGTIQINTLRRAAEALNCRFVYAIVPKKSVEATFKERLRFAARCKVEMNMKPKAAKGKDIEALVDTMAERMKPHKAWDVIAPVDTLSEIAEPEDKIDPLACTCASCTRRRARPWEYEGREFEYEQEHADEWHRITEFWDAFQEEKKRKEAAGEMWRIDASRAKRKEREEKGLSGDQVSAFAKATTDRSGIKGAGG